MASDLDHQRTQLLRLVALIRGGASWQECAELLDVSTRTVARWRQHPLVCDALREPPRLDQIADPASVLAEIRGKIVAALSRGVDVIVEIMEDRDVMPQHRIKAFQVLAERVLPSGQIVQVQADVTQRWQPEDYRRVSEALAVQMGVLPKAEGE